MKIWILTGDIESGDVVGPFIWKNKPTKEEVEEELKRCFPDDFEAGLIYYAVQPEEVIEN